MAATPQVLFVQGAGEGTHDGWDAKLVASLARELGDGYEVRYPRMPHEADPSYARWSAAIAEELAAAEDGVIVVGHSAGGAILAAQLADAAPARRIGAIVLIAAPFVGAGGWPGEEFTLPLDLGARLPQGVPVHVFHGLDDDTVPPTHAALYWQAVPEARLHLLPGRDHQLNDDLSEIAVVLTTTRASDGVTRPQADAPIMLHGYKSDYDDLILASRAGEPAVVWVQDFGDACQAAQVRGVQVQVTRAFYADLVRHGDAPHTPPSMVRVV
ncbi:Predicted esterase of the alpha/beta hydrolase fold [Jatrophihabitans endophyticus]|uniref:Predicted esterase of the alpha/beta hydrolase fold n=2 Tax=Jatrophihabitans endophyticus TaxID=1206085 RepID=A0A1M5TFR0_9ACTN|nr:Predicted esterase of the alpha/beta hydrolase fold [Jatrophihabitans endophyticus]